MKRLVALAGTALLVGGTFAGTALADDPANQYFLATWQRTDLPVANLQVSRTWMWGPQGSTGALQEPYEQAPNGERTVQYFDKSRMEINSAADPNSPWYVTNGLLSKELITGQLQVGDNQFETRSPANVNVAGDPDDANGVMYSSLTNHLGIEGDRTGELVQERINRAGTVTFDTSLANHNVTYGQYATQTGHNIATPFWEFMNSSGLVYENGQYVNDALFLNAFYATGFPITEPYWVNAQVAGVETLVLMQCFERRCLTYTASNAQGWQVEAGNVGQHYYSWRYDSPPVGGDKIAFQVEYANGNSDLWVINPDAGGADQLTDNTSDVDESPTWSPNRQQIAFAANPNGNYDIYVMGADGSSITPWTTDSGDDRWPAWQPGGGTEIAYACGANVCLINDQMQSRPLTTFANGVAENLSWSPDGTKIAFDHTPSGGTGDVYWVSLDGQTLEQLTDNPAHNDVHPSWSPDGTKLAFSVNDRGAELYSIYLINSDGTGVDAITDGGDFGGSDQAPVWSPTGSLVAFVRFTSGQGDIATIDTSSFVYTQLTLNPNDTDEGPSWSADGTHIAFWANPGGATNIYVMDSQGNNIEPITSNIGTAKNPVWVK
jgi:Tol biopolymer transport system component